MFDRIFFILGEALVTLKRNFGMAFLAIITVAVSLYVIGGLALAYFGIYNYGQGLTGKFEMRIYVKDGTSNDTISAMAGKMRKMSGVGTVNWIPRDKAWAKYRQENPELTRGLENPFPDAFKIVLSDLGEGDSVATMIRAMPEIEEGGVKYMQAEQQFIDQGLKLLKWIGTTAGGLLVVIAGVLIFTVVRLTAISRKVELRIMQLVGASYSTTYMPFLIEGIVQGALGGALSGLLLKLTYDQFEMVLRSYDSMSKLPIFPIQMVFVYAVSCGAVYGLLCSCFALIRLQRKIR